MLYLLIFLHTEESSLLYVIEKKAIQRDSGV